LEKGEPVKGGRTVFAVQETLTDIDPPKFSEVPSFNYEASAA
jgi:hypothetical protein